LKSNGPTLFARLGHSLAAPFREVDLPAETLRLSLSADPTRGWSIIIPQGVADSLRWQVTTIYLTGSSQNGAQPLGAVAVIDSSAPPTVIPLSTTPSLTR
jgi:hypothetical protein